MWCRKVNCAARWRPALPARKIVFSGVGKTAREMALALKEGIACFNVESEPELELLSQCRQRAWAQRATVSIRVNPDVDAKTHAKITTGKADNKFGISYLRASEVYARAAELAGASMLPASTCTSAARSPNLRPSKRPIC